MKDRKIRIYEPVEVFATKPLKFHVRRFIHTEESGGFWTEMRDTTIAERLGNGAKVDETVVVFTMGYNPEVEALWDRLIIIDEAGRTYRMAAKPDRYNYDRREDMKLTAQRCTDSTAYKEDRYHDLD